MTLHAGDSDAWIGRLSRSFESAFPAATRARVDRLQFLKVDGGVERWRFRIRWIEPEGPGQAILALRIFPDRRRCEREIAALRLARDVDVPAPEVWLAAERERPPFLAHEWVEGEPFSLAWRRRREGATPELLATTLLDLHDRTTGRVRSPRRLADRLAELRREAEAADAAELGERAERLRAGAPRDARPALCHGSFRPENVLLRRGGAPIVVEWGRAEPGDPRLDLARTSLVLRDEYGGALRTPFLRAYRGGRSVDPDELAWFEELASVEAALREAPARGGLTEGDGREGTRHGSDRPPAST